MMLTTISEVASIIGLIISVIGLFIAGATYNKVSKYDNSNTKNVINNSDFSNSKYIGRDNK